MHSPQVLHQTDIKVEKRVNVLMQNQRNEHQHLMESHHKEMQKIRDETKIALQKAESLAEQNRKDFLEMKDAFFSFVTNMKEKYAAQALTIDNHSKVIIAFNQMLNDFSDSKASKEDINKFKKDMESKITEAIMSNIVSFQNAQREFKEILLLSGKIKP